MGDSCERGHLRGVVIRKAVAGPGSLRGPGVTTGRTVPFPKRPVAEPSGGPRPFGRGLWCAVGDSGRRPPNCTFHTSGASGQSAGASCSTVTSVGESTSRALKRMTLQLAYPFCHTPKVGQLREDAQQVSDGAGSLSEQSGAGPLVYVVTEAEAEV